MEKDDDMDIVEEDDVENPVFESEKRKKRGRTDDDEDEEPESSAKWRGASVVKSNLDRISDIEYIFVERAISTNDPGAQKKLYLGLKHEPRAFFLFSDSAKGDNLILRQYSFFKSRPINAHVDILKMDRDDIQLILRAKPLRGFDDRRVFQIATVGCKNNLIALTRTDELTGDAYWWVLLYKVPGLLLYMKLTVSPARRDVPIIKLPTAPTENDMAFYSILPDRDEFNRRIASIEIMKYGRANFKSEKIGADEYRMKIEQIRIHHPIKNWDSQWSKMYCFKQYDKSDTYAVVNCISYPNGDTDNTGIAMYVIILNDSVGKSLEYSLKDNALDLKDRHAKVLDCQMHRDKMWFLLSTTTVNAPYMTTFLFYVVDDTGTFDSFSIGFYSRTMTPDGGPGDESINTSRYEWDFLSKMLIMETQYPMDLERKTSDTKILDVKRMVEDAIDSLTKKKNGVPIDFPWGSTTKVGRALLRLRDYFLIYEQPKLNSIKMTSKGLYTNMSSRFSIRVENFNNLATVVNSNKQSKEPKIVNFDYLLSYIRFIERVNDKLTLKTVLLYSPVVSNEMDAQLDGESHLRQPFISHIFYDSVAEAFVIRMRETYDVESYSIVTPVYDLAFIPIHLIRTGGAQTIFHKKFSIEKELVPQKLTPPCCIKILSSEFGIINGNYHLTKEEMEKAVLIHSVVMGDADFEGVTKLRPQLLKNN